MHVHVCMCVCVCVYVCVCMCVCVCVCVCVWVTHSTAIFSSFLTSSLETAGSSMAWNGMETCPVLKCPVWVFRGVGTLTNATDASDTGRMVSVRPS